MSWPRKLLWFAVWMVCVYAGLVVFYSQLPDQPAQLPAARSPEPAPGVGLDRVQATLVLLEFFLRVATYPLQGLAFFLSLGTYPLHQL